MLRTSDATLVRRSLTGDREAFGALVDRYRGMVFASILGHGVDREESQDLCQDVFVEAYTHLSTLKDPSKFAGWVRGIASNVCRMWWRRNTRGQIRWEDRSVRVLLPDPATAGIVYAAHSTGIFKSTDGGSVWQRTRKGNAYCLTFDPRNMGCYMPAWTAACFEAWTQERTGQSFRKISGICGFGR